MRFDLIDLRLVLNVAEAASITHGAARSGMALASASERIRAMEDALGVPLFDRKRRGVSPTAAGAALVEHARLVTQQLERMRGELNQHAKGLRGRIRLLSNTAATLEFLPPLLGRFLSNHPNVDVDLEERTSPEITRAVAGRRADIGIVADAVDAAAELETFPFAEDRLVLVTPQQEHLDGHAARLGHRSKLRVRLPGFDAVCRVVESGIGVAVVSRIAADRCRRTMAIRIVPLTDPWALRHLRICVKSRRALPLHAQLLVEHLRASARP